MIARLLSFFFGRPTVSADRIRTATAPRLDAADRLAYLDWTGRSTHY